MKDGNLPGLSPLWLISLAMVLGTLIVVMIPVSIATGDNVKSSDWIGFAGGVVVGAIALLAAILAWFAVQRQITAQEDAESALLNGAKNSAPLRCPMRRKRQRLS
jgi:hypothetical protein